MQGILPGRAIHPFTAIADFPPDKGLMMMDDTSEDEAVPVSRTADDPFADVELSKLQAYRRACIKNHYRQNWRTCLYKGCRRNQRCMGGPRGTFTRFGQPWCTGSCYVWEPPEEWLPGMRPE